MYGGTKAELERLIADAASYTEVQREMGIVVDATSMSFDNIVNAIAVVQGKLGIAGATSLEAATTIEGSFNSMKAAWENLITGMSDQNADFGGLVGQLVDTASTFAENLLPVIEKAVTGSAELVGTLAPQILEKIPELLSMLLPKAVEVLSTIVSTVVSILPNILTLLTGDAIPMLLSAIETIFNELVSALPNLIDLASGALSTLLPLLINTALSLVMALLDNIDSIIAPLAEALPEILIKVLDSITSNLPSIVNSLIDAIVSLLPELIPLIIDLILEVLPELFSGIFTGVVKSIPSLLKGIGQIFLQILENLPKILLALLVSSSPLGLIFLALYGLLKDELDDIFAFVVEFLANAWEGIVEFFTEKVPEFLSQFFDWIKELPEKIAYYIGFAIGFFQSLPLKILSALLQIIVKFLEWRQSLIEKVKEQLPIVIENIVEFFKNLPDKIRDWLGEVITKFISWTADFVEDVKETVPDIIDKIVSFFEDLPETIKEVGGNIISGLWEGIQSGVETLKTNVKTVCDTVIQGFKDGWQIKSPSRVAKFELAKNVILGISGGFKDFSGLAVKAMEDVSDEIYDAFDNGYDIEYAVDTASTPYEGETLTQSLANAMNALISVEDNKKIDVEISIDGSNTEVGRMLLNLINVTAKEVYA